MGAAVVQGRDGQALCRSVIPQGTVVQAQSAQPQPHGDERYVRSAGTQVQVQPAFPLGHVAAPAPSQPNQPCCLMWPKASPLTHKPWRARAQPGSESQATEEGTEALGDEFMS
ncbi:MAG: hypothetical protein CM15mP18_0690 [Methanobacteriota archaeon]|nr:MAG: hypothetical protein CM15mP18_0690 [Euryarchaeota archaeon]